MFKPLTTAMLCCCFSLAVLSGCSGSSDGEDASVTKPGMTVKGLSVSGTTSDPSTVTVNDQADSDGVANVQWSASFDLDGGSSPTSLPQDQGATTELDLSVKATRSSDAAESKKSVRVTVYEAQ